MKRIKNMVFGGIQQKMFNLVLGTILLIILTYTVVILYNANSLKKLVAETNEKQSEVIMTHSQETMNSVVHSSFSQTTEMKSYIIETLFQDIKGDVMLLGDYAEKIFADPSDYSPQEVSLPDPSNDGITSVQVLTEEGVDPEDPAVAKKLQLAANLSDMMVSLLDNTQLTSCLVALPEGAMLVTDRMSGSKFDQDGTLTHLPVRQRPWYTGAVEKGALYFSDVEKDTFTGSSELLCTLPIYHDNELVAVVGAELFLTGLEDAVADSDKDGSLTCIINESGHVLFSPASDGIFQVKVSSEAADLRVLGNEELTAFLNDALKAQTDVRLIEIDGKSYYLCGAPMETVGWAVLSVVEKDLIDMPSIMMLEQHQATLADARDAYYIQWSGIKRMIYIMVAAVLLFGIGAALALAGKIVRPLNLIYKRIQALGGKNVQFMMEDAYRTGDEIEELAEAFARLSAKTVQYVNEVKQVTAEKERIGAELNMATKIQESQLPRLFPPFPSRPEFDIYASMHPAKEVGGDFYDFFLVDDNHICMVMADVSGKGVPAALFMMVSRVLIKSHMQAGESPAEALANVNDQLCESNEAEFFVTVWLAVVEISTGKGIAANAGHEHPVLRRKGGEFELVVYRHSPAVAAIDNILFREHEFEMHPGDSLYVYTDGVAEATNNENELYGTERMLKALNKNPDAEPDILLTTVADDIDAFVGGATQFDDITMLCMRYNGIKEGKKLVIEATLENLRQVLAFVDEQLEEMDCPPKSQMQIDLAVEELYVNIANYAYAPGTGQAEIEMETFKDRGLVSITFIDSGVPYNPLAKKDPDVTLSAAEREIGGLGIFMAKKSMDDIAYEYRDGQNRLTIRKKVY